MAETLGLATSSHSRAARNAPRPALEVQDDHTAVAGRVGPVVAPPPVILSGALAKLNLFENQPRRVEPIYPATRGRLV
ncbi:MAG: hypothetical protein RID42_11430 [Alphaproteobacteria bacterium]